MNSLGTLAARARVHLDVAVERALRILEAQIALAAAEQRHEDLTEVLTHLRERGEEQLARGRVDLANRLLERVLRLREVIALRRQEVEASHLLLVLLDRERIHDAQLL